VAQNSNDAVQFARCGNFDAFVGNGICFKALLLNFSNVKANLHFDIGNQGDASGAKQGSAVVAARLDLPST